MIKFYTSADYDNDLIMAVGDMRYVVPMDERNADYRTYLKWVEEGNVAEEWVEPDGL